MKQEPAKRPGYTPDEFSAFELGAISALDFAMALASAEPYLSGPELIDRLLEYRNRAHQIPRELREWKLPCKPQKA